MNKIREKNLIHKTVLIIAIFSAMVIFDFATASSPSENQIIEFEKSKEDLGESSPFANPEPRIDPQAASIEKTGNGKINYEMLTEGNKKCYSLPQNFWVMMLAAYVFLLIFNLTYKLKESAKLRWFWETLYTVLALLAWYEFDECRKFTWFAQSVILEGIVIYAFYLYYFNKKRPAAAQVEKNKTAKLPLK